MRIICVHKEKKPHRIHRAWYNSIGAEYYHISSKIPEADVYIIDGMASIPPLMFRKGKVILLNSDTFFYNLERANPAKKLAYKYCLTRVDGIISTSFMLRDMAKKYTGVPHKVVYPFCNDNFLIRRANIESKDICYFGRFTTEKNINLIIKAFKKVNPENKGKLILVGGEYKTNEPNVIVRPFTDNVPEEIKDCGLFIMLSRYDSFGASIIEAMGMGLPTIVSEHCGAKELVPPKLVVDLDIDKIANLIDELNSDVALKKRLSILSRNEALLLNELNSINDFKKAFAEVQKCIK